MRGPVAQTDTQPSKPSRRLTPVTAVFLIVLVDVLGFTIILPLLPFYAEHYGASPSVIGMLLATYAVCQLFSGPFLGRLSDKMGRKPLLLVSQAGTFIGFLVVAFAPNLFFLFLGRTLDGLTAGNISLAQAVISDHTPPQQRGKAFSKIGIAFGFGFLIGPAISGYLAHFSFQAPIFAGAALSALSFTSTVFLLPKDTPMAATTEAGTKPKVRTRLVDWAPIVASFRQPELRLRLAQFFFFIMSFSTFVSGLPLFASRQLEMNGHKFGPSDVAYVLAFGGLVGMTMQALFIGRFIARFGERRLVTYGFVGLCTGYSILSQSHGLMLALCAVFFSSIGQAVLRPSLTSLITQSAGRGEQGTVLGVSQSLQSVGQILAPLIGGFLIEHGLPSFWAVGAALFAAIGVSLGFGNRRLSGSHRTKAT